MRSSVDIDGANGFVLFGDSGDDACAGNSILGSMSITNGNAAVDMRSNVLSSSLDVDQNKGGGAFPVDIAPVVAANRMGGRLSCKSNSPAPVNVGAVNTAPTKFGQCATL